LAEVSVPDILDDTRADPHEREMAFERLAHQAAGFTGEAMKC
jgi:hypothetical protein